MPKGQSIKGVEIFSTGKWNGDTFTEKDLDNMVYSFEQTKDHIPPYLKLGHDKKQALLQADGLPAAGWVEKLYRKGNKLFADFRDIPQKIYELLEVGAYRKPSIELFSNLNILDKKYENVIGAIALLGANTPGVMNLNDILARYGLKDYDKQIKVFTDDGESAKIYEYTTINSTEGDLVPELNKELIDAQATIKNLEAKIKNFETNESKIKADSDAIQAELEKMKTDLENTRKEFSANAEKLKQTEIEKQVAELESAKVITKAMKPFVVQLLDADKKEFTITKDKKEENLTRFDLIKETLKLAKASDVNFDNNSLDAEGESKKFSIDSAEKEIEKYMADNKCDYSTAYKAVIKQFDVDASTATDEDEDGE